MTDPDDPPRLTRKEVVHKVQRFMKVMRDEGWDVTCEIWGEVQ